jgi:hypothetical protein
MPLFNAANLSTSVDGEPSSLRTWAWQIVAPASKASWVDSICSLTVIGTAGLSLFFGNDPVIATQIMQGLAIGVRFNSLQVAGIRDFGLAKVEADALRQR